MIVIADYGSGNIKAIKNIYKRLNIECSVASTPAQLQGASKIILPGVGAFDETISELARSGMRDELDDLVLVRKVPVLGVCVGMQIMATNSEEGRLKGLSWFDAEVKQFDERLLLRKPKLPHMGWNDIHANYKHSIFDGVDMEQGFYFLHSYYFQCADERDVLANASYGKDFHCAVNRGNIYGFQFHPEKSHSNGIQLFKNFAEL